MIDIRRFAGTIVAVVVVVIACLVASPSIAGATGPSSVGIPSLSSFLLNQVGLLLIIVRTGGSTAGHYLELFGCCAKLMTASSCGSPQPAP